MAISDYYTSTVTRKVLSKANSIYGADGTETFSGSTTISARIWKLKANEVVLDESQRPLVTNRAACDADNTVLYTDRWNKLGNELITNGGFVYWTGTTPTAVPDGWTLDGEDEDNFVQDVTNACRFGSDSPSFELIQSDVLTIGVTYRYSLTISVISGNFTMNTESSQIDFWTTTGTKTGTFVADGNDIVFKKSAPAALVVYFSDVSIKEAAVETYDIISVNLNEDKSSSHHYEVELRLV